MGGRICAAPATQFNLNSSSTPAVSTAHIIRHTHFILPVLDDTSLSGGRVSFRRFRTWCAADVGRRSRAGGKLCRGRIPRKWRARGLPERSFPDSGADRLQIAQGFLRYVTSPACVRPPRVPLHRAWECGVRRHARLVLATSSGSTVDAAFDRGAASVRRGLDEACSNGGAFRAQVSAGSCLESCIVAERCSSNPACEFLMNSRRRTRTQSKLAPEFAWSS
jgi:hypothetical protein